MQGENAFRLESVGNHNSNSNFPSCHAFSLFLSPHLPTPSSLTSSLAMSAQNYQIYVAIFHSLHCHYSTEIGLGNALSWTIM